MQLSYLVDRFQNKIAMQRIVVQPPCIHLGEPGCRTLTYDFRSLKGIVFGMRTPNSDKLRIIETIHKKCQENDRSDFELFQAYYSPEAGGIEKYRLNLKLSV